MKKNDRPEISDDDSEEDKKQNVNNNNKKGEEKTELQLLKEKAAKKNSSSEDEEDESEYDPYKVPLRFLSVFTPQELDMTKHLYQDLDDEISKELLLENIILTNSSKKRKLGKVLSKRIYEYLN